MEEPIYDHITVDISGENGNAYFILGIVTREMRNHGVTKSEIEKFQQEAMSRDYNHLLVTCSKYVHLEN